MDEKTMQYVCAICGESYEHIEERIKCETKCLKTHKAAEEQKRLNEIAEKRKNSERAIEEKLAEADTMIKEHIAKYETLALCHNYYYLAYIFKTRHCWF